MELKFFYAEGAIVYCIVLNRSFEIIRQQSFLCLIVSGHHRLYCADSFICSCHIHTLFYNSPLFETITTVFKRFFSPNDVTFVFPCQRVRTKFLLKRQICALQRNFFSKVARFSFIVSLMLNAAGTREEMFLTKYHSSQKKMI